MRDEDAAQQVLMSSVGLSVRLSAKLKFYLLTNVPETGGFVFIWKSQENYVEVKFHDYQLTINTQ